MPRLIGRAHWLRDVLVGGGAIVLALSSLYLATPVHKIVVDYLLKYVTSVLCYFKNSQLIRKNRLSYSKQ